MVAELAIPKLDGLFIKSAFQRVKAADEEIQTGIAEAVSRQLEVEVEEPAAPILEPAQETQPGEIPVEEAPVVAESSSTNITEEIPASEEAPVAPAAATIPGFEAFSNATPEQIAALMAHFQQLKGGAPTADNAAPISAAPAAEAPKQQESVAAEPAVSETVATEIPVVEKSAVVEEVTVFEETAPTTEPAEQPKQQVSIEEAATPVAETIEPSQPAAVEAAPEPVNAEAAASEFELDIDSLLEGLASEALENEGVYKSEDATAQTKTVPDEAAPKPEVTPAARELTAEELAQRKAERHAEEDGLSRMPRNVQAYYLQPLRRVAEYGIPSCDLQLRSYSVRPLEFFADFALRAAYYLGLPAYGPVPLPKITERWTVPKSNFIHKKSQENFERITRRRLIQIKDGNPETVQIWLAFLQKHQQAAVGMKANIWEFSNIGKIHCTILGAVMSIFTDTFFFSTLDVAKELGAALEAAQPLIDDKARFLSQNKDFATVEKVDELLQSEKYRLVGAQYSYNEVKLR